MSLMDSLSQMASQFGGKDAGTASHLVAKFHQNGLGDVVNSWVGNGENQQIAANHIEQVLGPDKVAAIAGKLGMSPDEAKAKLATMLPQIVNKLTPAGKVASA
jgi:uncharacterized protein YidB (DUF937 family)